MHDAEFEHEHEEMTDEERAALAQLIWSQDNIELKTVDIGSSTSHLLFAKVTLQRQSQGLSSRFIAVDRQIIWRSPIILTPFLPDGTIDAATLAQFIHGSYRDAGIAPGEIDSGAVILTGEAIKRRNARPRANDARPAPARGPRSRSRPASSSAAIRSNTKTRTRVSIGCSLRKCAGTAPHRRWTSTLPTTARRR
jgi:hypothetical protein